MKVHAKPKWETLGALGVPFTYGLTASSSSHPTATESSESSQCVSRTGSSGSDSGCASSIPRDSFCEELGSPLSTPASSSLASPLEEKSCFSKSQYVSAVSGQENLLTQSLLPGSGTPDNLQCGLSPVQRKRGKSEILIITAP